MAIRSKSRALFVAAVLALGLTAGAARADVLFHNDTDRPVHFGLSCTTNGQDKWTVAPHKTASIYCNNGNETPRVEIRTTHGDQDMVVRGTVHDGVSYRLGYDNDGDMNIFRLS